jgi:hypothetical protein
MAHARVTAEVAFVRALRRWDGKRRLSTPRLNETVGMHA